MASSITAAVGSYESGATNLSADIRTVQELLTQAAKKLNTAAFNPGGVDGKIGRPGKNSNTVKAIVAFQKQQVGMTRPDERIDVNGSTWKKLVAVAGGGAAPKPPAGAVGLITLTVSHGGLIPKGTRFKTATLATAGHYESTFTLSGGLVGTFSGSVWPDDMTVKGRVIDGTYPLHIGFHKGGGAAKQGADKLVVATSGIRPGLLVNARASVPVQSDNPDKTTSVGINVHNGYSATDRESDGCLTLLPADWSRFITLFLDAFPNIDDWHAKGTNTGKKVGSLVIQA